MAGSRPRHSAGRSALLWPDIDTNVAGAYDLAAMRKQISMSLSTTVALAFALGLFSLSTAQAQMMNQMISKTAMTGAYSVTLKVMPAESFSGPNAAMVRDAGAQPLLLHAPVPPNHHLVAFVQESGKPVLDAKVSISYRELSPKKGEWMSLPVVRMHMAGKGLQSTHYGNNVKLDPGSYEARVTVNGSKPANFEFTLQH